VCVFNALQRPSRVSWCVLLSYLDGSSVKFTSCSSTRTRFWVVVLSHAIDCCGAQTGIHVEYLWIHAWFDTTKCSTNRRSIRLATVKYSRLGIFPRKVIFPFHRVKLLLRY
jgi:hypothetical protein